MQVGKFLKDRPLYTVTPEDTLAHAAALMKKHGHGSASVLAPGEPPGIITERDLLRAVADGVGMKETPVERYMTPRAVTVTPSWHVVDAAKMMIERHFRHLVVVDDAGNVLGVLSIRDMTTALLEERGGILAG